MPLIPISAIDDPRLDDYRDLPQRNLTRQSGRFIAEGDKVTERLIASHFPVESIFAEPELGQRYASQVPAATPIYTASRQVLEATLGFKFHRGVMACGRRLPRISAVDWLRDVEAQSRLLCSLTIVVCPDVQDPTNLGSIIRSAAAFGCGAVVLGERCADPFSRRVLRVSMGAVLQLPVIESADLAGDLRLLNDARFELMGTVLDPSAEPLDWAKRGDRLAILFGSEGHGLTPEMQALCGRRVTIPMQAGIDSLNVAIAAAVVLYHFCRAG